MARPGLMLYFDILPALDSLPNAAVGELLLAALRYAQDGVDPVFGDPSLEFAWAFIKPAVDRDGATYEEKRLKGEWLAYCKKCVRDGVEQLDFETWRERIDNSTQRTDNVALPTTSSSHLQPIPSSSPNNRVGADKPPASTPGMRKQFIPPTLDEVTAYVKERGSRVDPQGFIDFYAAKGWLVGKTPMKDWKAACRNAEHWERWDKPQPTDRNRLRTDADYMGGGDFFGGEG